MKLSVPGRIRFVHVAGAAAVVVVALIAAAHVRGRIPEVSVAEAQVGAMTLRIAASGLVEADSADLSFQGAGRIAEVYVQEGDRFARTDLLARLMPVGAPPGTLGAVDVIQAPYDGRVVAVYRRVGAVVQPGQPVLRVVSHAATWVVAFIESDDAMHLRAGHRLRCRAGGYLSQPWDLTVEEVGAEAVPRPDMPGSSHQVRVRCAPDNPAFPIPAGTEVDVDGEIPLVERGLLIPTAAVVQLGVEDIVWVLRNGHVERRSVTVGPNNFNFIEIREGLRPGETVVVQGKEDLTEGDRVRTRPMPPMVRPEEEAD